MRVLENVQEHKKLISWKRNKQNKCNFSADLNISWYLKPTQRIVTIMGVYAIKYCGTARS
jgi:hypothetical protein